MTEVFVEQPHALPGSANKFRRSLYKGKIKSEVLEKCMRLEKKGGNETKVGKR